MSNIDNATRKPQQQTAVQGTIVAVKTLVGCGLFEDTRSISYFSVNLNLGAVGQQRLIMCRADAHIAADAALIRCGDNVIVEAENLERSICHARVHVIWPDRKIFTRSSGACFEERGVIVRRAELLMGDRDKLHSLVALAVKLQSNESSPNSAHTVTLIARPEDHPQLALAEVGMTALVSYAPWFEKFSSAVQLKKFEVNS